MSSERGESNAPAASPRFPGRGYSPQGQPGAKARPEGVADAQPVDIQAPARERYDRWGDGGGQLDGVLDVPAMAFRALARQIRPADKPEAPDEGFGRSESTQAPEKNP